MPLLGVNVDHVAAIRQARFTSYPDPLEAALVCEKAGADGITIHLREDRRHIQEKDCLRIKKKIKTKLNLEMALSREITNFALKLHPDDVCIVPEKRKELTTEGGLDVFKHEKELKKIIPLFSKKGIRVSLFIEASEKAIALSKKLGADAVELHTGAYANLRGQSRAKELIRIKKASSFALKQGLLLNAGHGLDYDNTPPIARIKGMNELNIGHSIIAYAVFAGLDRAVRDMKKLLS
ncbi:MAG: pyridoxine 5'-phosphate synthase [Elusimicrobia bacterium CG03_land_8_20_14_0_80_50_18]|nr:MAG: pyridoxine 5'-phosphate synthase [Elusimicrobia bacterium CG03_land_8_20_14_0_80_50_18]